MSAATAPSPEPDTRPDQLVARLQAQYGLSAPRARELLDEFWRECACWEPSKEA